MSSGMLNIGISGLFANQLALRTTSHNVSNVNTEGYSRQRVEFETRPPQLHGDAYLGTGVSSDGIQRMYDSFLTSQVNQYSSSYSHAEIYSRHASLLDELLADPKAGMMPAIEDFFGAVQGVSQDAPSIPARQSLLTNSETLVDRFHYINQRFIDLREQINDQIDNYVAEINGYAEAIAQMNKQIILAPGNSQPNDLLDERDRLIKKLSEIVSVSTVPQDDGSMNVFIGKGQTVVLGINHNQLYVTKDRFDISESEISIDDGAGFKIEISDLITGGKVGGLLEFRKEILDEAQNDLGVLAIGLAESFNVQHQLGQDLNGNLGKQYFDVGTMSVLPATGAGSTVTANLADYTQLTGDDYRLQYNGANSYTLTRLSDSQTFAINTGGAYPYTTVPIDGFTLTLAGGDAVGDQFEIRPSRNGALNIRELITDPKEVAAATPIRTEIDIINTGNGQISPGSVNSVANLPLPGNVTLTYNLGLNQFAVAGAVPPVAPIPYVDGATIAFNGLEFVITGAPANGDQFVISNTAAGVSDNRNSNLLAELQNQSLLNGGTASYQDFYGNLVADVGIKTAQASVTEESQQTLLNQALDLQQETSGVNLDEEAANLIKFQMAYQASAQVISAADNMFQALLGVFR